MKVILYKLKADYKLFRQGTIFEKINGKFLVNNEFHRCIDNTYFDDINLQIKFKDIMEEFGSMKIEETAYYRYNMRHFDNNIRVLEEKLKVFREAKQDFLKSVGAK